MNLYIVETSAPFFLFSTGKINWSKIPFNDIETERNFSQSKFNKIIPAYTNYLHQIKKIGYNAMSIDDLSHLVNRSFYPDKLQKKITSYEKNYRLFFKIAQEIDLGIYTKTDLMFYNCAIKDFIKKDRITIFKLMADYLEQLFVKYPLVKGVIIRIGEKDGVDVRGDFKSELTIKSPKDLRAFIISVLPLFHRYKKTLIIRTWTVGAYEIGDLIWNKETYQKVFKDIEDENLVVSMKYGESDFFRYLDMSDAIFDTKQKKIIEFQAKREYEGFGEFPVFTGWEYKRYLSKLSRLNHIIGIWSWPQEGRWSSMSPRLTYVTHSSLWNELNTYSILKIAKDCWSVKKCIKTFYKNTFPDTSSDKKEDAFVTLLRLSDKVINKGFYIEELAKKQLYFRRTRVPPLLFPWWQNGSINDLNYSFIKRYVVDKKKAIRHGQEALRYIKQMKKLSKGLNLKQDFNFYYDTFYILYLIRKAIFAEQNLEKKIKATTKIYSKKYHQGFFFDLNITKNKLRLLLFNYLFKIVIREKSPYRLFDKIILNTKITTFLGKLVAKPMIKFSPLDEGIAMPITILFQ